MPPYPYNRNNEEILDLLCKRTNCISTGCWLWIGPINRDGYGQISIARNNIKLVHRIGYELLIGKINNSLLHKDNICNNKNCWNPNHLYDGTQFDNMQDKHRKLLLNNLTKTHCKNGHELNSDNKGKFRGTIYCKECKRTRQKEYQRLRK